ncbi:Peroxyureidoacrylate/ureidoacrylate amidohydrolase RutB [Streptomyces sp. RB5]|uniref:Peroxyureidoacrylate/ureidoacrylate amidohydrolase RutB n=1 Tax=Streptomyces smaragdinus TaxID=2585196 RepID=A0A7K0CEI2_9ACTN|nr:isochorismatase family cysteine hydrolase [Streptomyces smaragdinus]MQY11753.1 Peroxyureidoacrylate/ureidoacrylate amidohydrolase RutB [Streptomyces smaragdinus]
MTPAVVVIDVQNDFCHPRGVFAGAGLVVDDLDGLVANINTLVARAREQDVPVVWVTMEWADDAEVGLLASRSPFLATAGLRAGTWGCEPVDGLDVRPADRFVRKTRFSSFHRTGLEATLTELGADTLVVAGVRTDFCVESTVRDAFFRDYRAVVVRDAVAGYFPDLHENSLRVMGTVFARIAGTASEALPLPVGGAG